MSCRSRGAWRSCRSQNEVLVREDLSVVGGDPRGNALVHPPNSVLVVEISETSLAFDREHKASLYARVGVPDYWILNLVDRRVEVYRDPIEVEDAPFGWRYERRVVRGVAGVTTPLAEPTARVAVADLLP